MMETRQTRQTSFRAMGTTVTLITDRVAPRRAFERWTEHARDIFEREEQRFSRFRDSSELSRVNAAAGTGLIAVSAPFLALTRLGLNAAKETHGSFDPTLLHALVAAGYDRDFDALAPRSSSHPRTPEAGLHATHPSPDLTPGRRWTDVETGDATISLPIGVALDFGGLAKGWTADLAAEAGFDTGLPWALVNAGGDLRITGNPPTALPMMIEDPVAPTEEAMRVHLTGGALATSSTRRRTWGAGAHHLIDPRTGRPSMTGVAQVTVWAPTCARAEILAKWALLNGPAMLLGPAMLVIHDDGSATSTFTQQPEHHEREAVA